VTELILTLDEKQLRRLKEQARHRQLTPEQLLQEYIDNLPAVPNPERTWQATVESLVALLSATEPETRQRAREQLAAFGSSIIPQLEQAIPTASPTLLVELATLLAGSGAPAAIRPLLGAYARREAENKAALYHEVRVLLGRYILLPEAAWETVRKCTPTTAPLVTRQLKEFLGLHTSPQDTLDTTQPLTAADVVSLITLLRWQKTGAVAQQVAHALTVASLDSPIPELRQALPLLRPAWHNLFAPAEFIQSVKAIEKATAHWADLPLPAESDDEPEVRDLPLPVDNSR
jgi:hypothetical protein